MVFHQSPQMHSVALMTAGYGVSSNCNQQMAIDTYFDKALKFNGCIELLTVGIFQTVCILLCTVLHRNHKSNMAGFSLSSHLTLL